MSRNKDVGTKFETAVADFLRAHGFPYAERRAQRGAKDCGDIAGIPGLVLECKRVARMELGEWMTEAQKEAITDHSYRFAVVHWRRGKNVREAYVTCPLWVFADLVRDDAPTEAAS